LDDNTGDAVSRLLSSAEFAVRLPVRRDLLGEKRHPLPPAGPACGKIVITV
jgi:hypothetical protein